MEKEKHDSSWGNMTRNAMVLEINRNVYFMARARYPWLAEIPNTWPYIVQFLESYTPLISTTVIRWKCPEGGRYKCNSDGFCQVNYGLCSKSFCIRDGQGDLVYARASKLEFCSSLEAELKVLKMVYCIA